MTLRNETLDTLCQLLQTGDEVDRCYTARALGTLGAAKPVEFLIERLKDEDLDVVFDAAEALGNIGEIEAVPALIESLENDPSGEVCAVAAEALGKIGSMESIDALLKILMERPEDLEWDDDWDRWWDVQREAVKALGDVKAEKAIDSLAAFLDDETQQDIEVEILNALVNISEDGVDQVTKRLQNKDRLPLHRRRAARALAKSAAPEATAALGRALMDKAPEVRTEAALSLASQNAEKYLGALVLMLRDSDDEARNAAVRSIIQLTENGVGSEDVEALLYPMLTDPNSQVRNTVLSAILPVVAHHPLSDDKFEGIVKCIDDTSAEVATTACTLLSVNGNPAAISPLLELIDNVNAHPMVRREAAISIGKLGQVNNDVTDTLIRAVGDKQQPVRLAALTALMALETSGIKPAEDEENHPPRPLNIVIQAVKGEVSITNDPAKEKALDKQTESVVVELSTDVTHQSPEVTEGPVPEVTEETMTLPETPAQIVEEGEVESALSTLDAIAMENVASMLNRSAPEEKPEHDAMTEEYLGIVEDNKDTMRRIRSNSKISPEQDVRRLGARVLAETEEELAVETLIQALNDDDSLVRREAAEAIGAIAQRNRGIPKLMDAVGTLITQLAISDIELKVTCARTLSYLGNRTALVPLMEATKSPETTLRIQAINALARLSTDSLDPDKADHMVVRDVPPLSIARKLMENLDDDDMGVRVAATKGLAKTLKPLKEEIFTQKAVEKIVSSVTLGTGEEARLIGRALRAFDTALANKVLLAGLETADNSVQRSVFIEMIEELLNPGQDQSEQAA